MPGGLQQGKGSVNAAFFLVIYYLGLFVEKLLCLKNILKQLNDKSPDSANIPVSKIKCSIINDKTVLLYTKCRVIPSKWRD